VVVYFKALICYTDIMIARGVLRECLAELDKLYSTSEPKWTPQPHHRNCFSLNHESEPSVPGDLSPPQWISAALYVHVLYLACSCKIL